MFEVFSPSEWVGLVSDADEALFWRAFGYTVELVYFVGSPTDPVRKTAPVTFGYTPAPV